MTRDDLFKEVKEKYGLDLSIGIKIDIPDECPVTEKHFYGKVTNIKKKEWYGKKLTISDICHHKDKILIEFLESNEGHFLPKWVIEDFVSNTIKKINKTSNKDLFGV